MNKKTLRLPLSRVSTVHAAPALFIDAAKLETNKSLLSEVRRVLHAKQLPLVILSSGQQLVDIATLFTDKHSGSLFWFGGPSLTERTDKDAASQVLEQITINASAGGFMAENVVLYGTSQVNDLHKRDDYTDESKGVSYEIDELRFLGVEDTLRRVVGKILTSAPGPMWVHISSDKISTQPDTQASVLNQQELVQCIEVMCAAQHVIGFSVVPYSSQSLPEDRLSLHKLLTSFFEKRLVMQKDGLLPQTTKRSLFQRLFR
jgi:hypothetical protein